MDSLSHLALACAGGYLLYFGMKLKLKGWQVLTLIGLSIIIDIDHLLPKFGIAKTLVFHNLATVCIIAIVAWKLFGKDGALVASVLLFGHILMDTNSGIYGVPFFYPLSRADFLIPTWMEVHMFGDPRYPLITTLGISLAVYFGAIIGLVAYRKLFSHKV